jgi:hypothetical protein
VQIVLNNRSASRSAHPIASPAPKGSQAWARNRGSEIRRNVNVCGVEKFAISLR